ncbi:MAG: hypothetical protein DRP45_04865 [Candidatus Zixiibacteriota bacterium]|nr:MAG: hypothetical protein DRP45_04865 [candidate division Zixibacteria bacterium]
MTNNTNIITPDTVPQTAEEFFQCTKSFQWFSKRFCMIADKNADTPHAFFMNPPQIKLDNIVNTYRNSWGGFQAITLKARQVGYSTYCTNRSFWKAETQPNFRALHVAHDTDGTSNMLDMIKLSHNSMPSTFQMPNGEVVRVQQEEVMKNRNELRLKFDEKGTMESHVRIKTAGAGGDVGRSSSPNFIHYSEVGNSVYDDGKVIGASMQGASQRAEVFAEGTADGAYGWLYETYNDAKVHWKAFLEASKTDKELCYDGWVPIFTPWFEMPTYAIAKRPNEVIEPKTEFEYDLMSGRITFNGYQVSQEQIKFKRFIETNRCPQGLTMSPEDWFKQEYAHNDSDCFISSGSNYFNTDVVLAGKLFADTFEKDNPTLRYCITNGEMVRDKYGPWQFIEEYDKDATYVIGGDVAEGLEHGDYDAGVIIKRVYDGPDWVVGYYRGKDPDKGRHAHDFGVVGYAHGTALIGIERNKDGISVNDHMERQGYPRQYLQTTGDEARYDANVHKAYGYLTNSKTKGVYLGQLQTALRKWYTNKNDREGLVIPFPYIWEELRTYSVTDGKHGASRGCYDDLVISTAIANQIKDEVRVGLRSTMRKDKTFNKPTRLRGKTINDIVGSFFR